jgi:hypothetical protein
MLDGLAGHKLYFFWCFTVNVSFLTEDTPRSETNQTNTRIDNLVSTSMCSGNLPKAA